MASRPVPHNVDTVIVGNGPSALILSYVLHGNIPYYRPTTPHPDSILHKKLSQSSCLLETDLNQLTAHFAASRLSYSTQALPINVLLDTLLRPLADTEPGDHGSCIQWKHEPEKRVAHIVLGNTAEAGGQWADNPVDASWDIGTLSYSDMLSLPGYSFEKHYEFLRNGKGVPEFYRPTRREVAAYLARYPTVVGIEDAVYTNTLVSDIQRTDHGFHIASTNTTCKHLVLASGVFSNLIAPRPMLQPLISLPPNQNNKAPLLVVGSGFTAADIILSTPPTRPIIHIYKWAPSTYPSPLKACHPSAYPEYAGVYRRMKLAARENLGPAAIISPFKRRKSNPFLNDSREWQGVYEGLPNTYIKDVRMQSGGRAILSLELGNGTTIEREVSGMSYVIGRRGGLEYLDRGLRREVLGCDDEGGAISGGTLRGRIEERESVQAAPDVFAIGSLTGDSLIRFAYGGCVGAARRIMGSTGSKSADPSASVSTVFGSRKGVKDTHDAAALNERDGRSVVDTKGEFISNNAYVFTNGHVDLGKDICAPHASGKPVVDQESIGCDMWQKPGLVAGGIGFS